MIRLALLITVTMASGCALTRPEVANFPPPNYLMTDEVQYYAPGPEFEEAKRAAELRAQAEEPSG